MECTDLLPNFNNAHFVAGPVKQSLLKFKALSCMDTNELEAIYYLLESHVPSFLFTSILRYEINVQTNNNKQCLNKYNVCIGDNNCEDAHIAENVNTMLNRIREMPPEWTIVQLTPHFNVQENLEMDNSKFYTNPLYLSLFRCGDDPIKPFCVTIDVPRARINGELIELRQEIHQIIIDNKSNLNQLKNKKFFKNSLDKQSYCSSRQSIDESLKTIVNNLQKLYMQFWRVFCIGKYEDSSIELKISMKINEFLQNIQERSYLSTKNEAFLLYLVKGAHYLDIIELKHAISTIFGSNINLQKIVAQFIKNLNEELNLKYEKRHPVILVLDDSVDIFPWEMMDVFKQQAVSRLPSFHLVYALYKEHETTIVNGYKIIKHPENGTFVVNPRADLNSMERRITSFLTYWTPKWRGFAGCAISTPQFEELIESGAIFSYNGHGSGSQHMPMERVERLRTEAVVLLFGCSSSTLTRGGPQVQMMGAFQMYFIARSPCVVGMLWEVTDLDTDLLTTNFLSLWVPGPKDKNWEAVDKARWEKGEEVDFEQQEISGGEVRNEPDLLRALSKTKHSVKGQRFYLTKAACVARGIPVKIQEGK